MSDVKIKDNHMVVQGMAYWRGGAANVDGVGAYGEIRRPVFGVDYLDQQGELPVDKLKIEKATVLDIDFQHTSDSDILANIKVPLVFKAQPQVACSKLRSGELKLAMFNADKDQLVDAINSSPRHLDTLAGLGGDARVCDTVFLVVDAKLAETFERSQSLSLQAVVKGVQISAEGSHAESGSTSITYEPGSVFGYGLVKPLFDGDRKKDRNKVLKLSTVQWGVLK